MSYPQYITYFSLSILLKILNPYSQLFPPFEKIHYLFCKKQLMPPQDAWSVAKVIQCPTDAKTWYLPQIAYHHNWILSIHTLPFTTLLGIFLGTGKHKCAEFSASAFTIYRIGHCSVLNIYWAYETSWIPGSPELILLLYLPIFKRIFP